MSLALEMTRLDRAQDREQRNAASGLIAVLPEPEPYARWLLKKAPFAAQCLAAAWIVSSGPQKGLLRVDERAAPMLANAGLVEVKGVIVGAFGAKVRDALLEVEVEQ